MASTVARQTGPRPGRAAAHLLEEKKKKNLFVGMPASDAEDLVTMDTRKHANPEPRNQSSSMPLHPESEHLFSTTGRIPQVLL